MKIQNNPKKFFLSQTMEEFPKPVEGVKYFQILTDLYNKVLLINEEIAYKISKEQFFDFIVKELNKNKTIFNWQNGIYPDDKNEIYINFPDKNEANKLIKILNKYFT